MDHTIAHLLLQVSVLFWLKVLILSRRLGGRCVNTPGSFKCSCASGYQGSGRQCVATKCSSTFKIWVGTEIDFCDAKTCTMKCSEGYQHSEGEYLQTCDWRGKWPSSTQLKCEGKRDTFFGHYGNISVRWGIIGLNIKFNLRYWRVCSRTWWLRSRLRYL